MADKPTKGSTAGDVALVVLLMLCLAIISEMSDRTSNKPKVVEKENCTQEEKK